MNDIVQIAAACLGSSGLTAIVLAILQRRWSCQDKQDALVAGLKVLTVDRVRYRGRGYILDGKISLEDRENLEEMYTAYKSLGGNGHLETIMAEVRKLPLKGETA